MCVRTPACPFHEGRAYPSQQRSDYPTGAWNLTARKSDAFPLNRRSPSSSPVHASHLQRGRMLVADAFSRRNQPSFLLRCGSFVDGHRRRGDGVIRAPLIPAPCLLSGGYGLYLLLGKAGVTVGTEPDAAYALGFSRPPQECRLAWSRPR
jgi:hypothetical protein